MTEFYDTRDYESQMRGHVHDLVQLHNRLRAQSNLVRLLLFKLGGQVRIDTDTISPLLDEFPVVEASVEPDHCVFTLRRAALEEGVA